MVYLNCNFSIIELYPIKDLDNDYIFKIIMKDYDKSITLYYPFNSSCQFKFKLNKNEIKLDFIMIKSKINIAETSLFLNKYIIENNKSRLDKLIVLNIKEQFKSFLSKNKFFKSSFRILIRFEFPHFHLNNEECNYNCYYNPINKSNERNNMFNNSKSKNNLLNKFVNKNIKKINKSKSQSQLSVDLNKAYKESLDIQDKLLFVNYKEFEEIYDTRKCNSHSKYNKDPALLLSPRSNNIRMSQFAAMLQHRNTVNLDYKDNISMSKSLRYFNSSTNKLRKYSSNINISDASIENNVINKSSSSYYKCNKNKFNKSFHNKKVDFVINKSKFSNSISTKNSKNNILNNNTKISFNSNNKRVNNITYKHELSDMQSKIMQDNNDNDNQIYNNIVNDLAINYYDKEIEILRNNILNYKNTLNTLINIVIDDLKFLLINNNIGNDIIENNNLNTAVDFIKDNDKSNSTIKNVFINNISNSIDINKNSNYNKINIINNNNKSTHFNLNNKTNKSNNNKINTFKSKYKEIIDKFVKITKCYFKCKKLIHYRKKEFINNIVYYSDKLKFIYNCNNNFIYNNSIKYNDDCNTINIENNQINFLNNYYNKIKPTIIETIKDLSFINNIDKLKTISSINNKLLNDSNNKYHNKDIKKLLLGILIKNIDKYNYNRKQIAVLEHLAEKYQFVFYDKEEENYINKKKFIENNIEYTKNINKISNCKSNLSKITSGKSTSITLSSPFNTEKETAYAFELELARLSKISNINNNKIIITKVDNKSNKYKINNVDFRIIKDGKDTKIIKDKEKYSIRNFIKKYFL